ncbi:MAG: hypothetical protein HRT35_37210, partial [Algicola sp.]|nr:hypothetical protein [Algicola sp.]
VVCGGFHCMGIVEALAGKPQSQPKVPVNLQSSSLQNNVHHHQLAQTISTSLNDARYMCTTPDVIEACVMSQRLGMLRGISPGRTELRDAMISCFLKQANDGGSNTFHQIVNRALIGEKTSRRLPPSM